MAVPTIPAESRAVNTAGDAFAFMVLSPIVVWLWCCGRIEFDLRPLIGRPADEELTPCGVFFVRKDVARATNSGDAATSRCSDESVGKVALLWFVHNGIRHVYPIAILNWHEVVNERLGDDPVAVTFCPLCSTGMVFSARVFDEIGVEILSPTAFWFA